MTVQSPAKLIAAVFAMSAFAVAVFAGLWAGNAAGGVVARAVFVLVIFHFVGYLIGSWCEVMIAAHIARYEASAKRASDSGALPVENSVKSSPHTLTGGEKLAA